jgi:hypothetical protein
VDSELSVARYAADISLWALYVSGGALFISACVFTLELRRWLDEGVRLSLRVMVDAKVFGGGVTDDETYLSLWVTNRGNTATTITHMFFFNYPNWFAELVPGWLMRRIARRAPGWANRHEKRLYPQTFVVNSIGLPGPIPFTLEPGCIWTGRATQDSHLDEMIDAGRLFVGIICSHREKTYFKHVRR